SDRSLRVQPRPQNSQDEAGRNGRADVPLHTLQVNIELAADQVNERDPGQTEHNHHAGHHPAETDQLPFARVGLDLFIEVERDQGRSRIEDRTHRPHQCRQQGGNHHADQSGREQIDDQRGISNVPIEHFAVGTELEQVAIERDRNQAGQHQHEYGQDLEKAGKNGGGLGVSFVLGREHALHNHLVGAPIPDAENGRAEENSGPGKVGIAHGLDHVEVAGGQGGAQAGKSSHLVHSNHGQNDGAENQDQGLHQVGINDRGQSSGNGVNTSGDNQNDRSGQRAPAHYPLQHNRGSV